MTIKSDVVSTFAPSWHGASYKVPGTFLLAQCDVFCLEYDDSTNFFIPVKQNC